MDVDSCSPIKDKKIYNTRRSAFWRVIRLITIELGIPELTEKWSEYIAWSNLYKVSPKKRGNPYTWLLNAQFEFAVRLLHEEIEFFKPKRILFLTGWNWAKDFISDQLVIKNKPGTYVEGIGYFYLSNKEASKVVIVKHPQGKKEKSLTKEVILNFS